MGGLNGAVIGGIMLIIGNYYVFKGEIYKSIKMFLIADFAWLLLAVESNNILGIISVTIGLILSIFAFFRMHKGVYRKNIHK